MDRARPSAAALNTDSPAPLAAAQPTAVPPAPLSSVLDAPPERIDPWPGAQPFALAGWFDRSGFTPGWTAVLAVVVGWVVFQIVANLGVAATLLIDLLGRGLTEPPTAEMLLAAVGEHAHAVLVWNSVGQAVGFGAFTWWLARLTTSAPAPFLRVGRVDAVGLGLAAVGWAALYPVVLVAGKLNSLVPLPDVLREADAARAEMLEGFLLGGDLSPLFLVLTVAFVPAVFEELLFRGYLMRQVERKFSPAVTFAVVGLTFGAYHLTAAQLLPLSILGAYLCFVVWATGSLWSGVLVHALNNGLAVAVSVALRGRADLDPETVGEVGGPWYVSAALALAGIAAVTAIVRLMLAHRAARTGGRPDAAPVPFLPLPAPLAVPS